MWIKILVIVFIVNSIAWGANDFSGDTNCVAVWNFEDGALTTDSKGTNTLTNDGGESDLVNFKQGSASVDLELSETDYLYINDADLDAGFPLKDGDTNKKISVCFWIKPESWPGISSQMSLFAKYSTSGLRSFYINAYNDTGDMFVRLTIGYSEGNKGETVAEANVNIDTLDVWYHITVTFQDSDKSWRIRVWDEDEGEIGETTGYTTNNINVETAPVTIGTYANLALWFDGIIDELVVFNDILTTDEIDEIWAGTYGAAPAVGQVIIVEEI